MVRFLLSNRWRIVRHQWRSLELHDAWRGMLFLLAGLGVLFAWVSHVVGPPLSQTSPSLLPMVARGEMYRVGAFLTVLISLRSFGPLWHGQELEMLSRFPIPPRSLAVYRMLLTGLENLPFYLLALFSFVPLLSRGAFELFGEALIYFSMLMATSIVFSHYFHMFAAASVGTSKYRLIKTLLAEAMVLKDRTLLLYSPFLGALFAFGLALVTLAGLAAASRVSWAVGLVVAAFPVIPLTYAWKFTLTAFERGYYRAVAALADGEVLGSLEETRPSPHFFGAFFTQRLPHPFRLLVEKDLKQVWRRSRVDIFALVALSAVVIGLTFRELEASQQVTQVRLASLALLTLAGGQAFRLSRNGSDAVWQWLTLPLMPQTLAISRALATAFFALLCLPGLAIALHEAGMGWGAAVVTLALQGGAISGVATVLSLHFFRQAFPAWMGLIAFAGGFWLISSGSLAIDLGMAVTSSLTWLTLPAAWRRLRGMTHS